MSILVIGGTEGVEAQILRAFLRGARLWWYPLHRRNNSAEL